jgi:hypothetical protein
MIEASWLTSADLLVRGNGFSPLPEPPIEVPAGTRSAVSGQPLTTGYPVVSVVTGATTEFLSQFNGNVQGWVSENEAICFHNASPRLGNPSARTVLVFGDGTYYNPMISRESARKLGRPCWSELVREVWPARCGQMMLMILTTDMKKRLWPRCRVGALGHVAPVYLYDGESNVAQNLAIDWQRLIECLDLVEMVYNLGFVKVAIINSLYMIGKTAQVVGLAKTRELEGALAAWRGEPEFKVATLIAQKQGETK